MASLYTVDSLPTSGAQAIQEFDDRYLVGRMAKPSAPDFSTVIGDVFDTPTPLTQFPVSLMSSKYEETKGDNRSKTIEEKSIPLSTVEFDEGYEAKLLDLMTVPYAWAKWQGAAARLIAAEARFVRRKLAALLEANAACGFDGVTLFHASGHLANPALPGAGTFGNLQGTGKACTIANIEAEIGLMKAAVLDENGDKMSPTPDTLVVPSAIWATVNNLLKSDIIANAAGTATISNPYLGTIQVLEAPDLTDANDWYLVDGKMIQEQACPVTVASRFVPPGTLGLRQYDESSDFFKNTGKLKVSSHIHYGFAGMFPHAIRKVTGA